MDLTISIVSYNSKDLLRECISSIYKYFKSISFEIIVVDNGSKDRTSEMIIKEFPKVKLIRNKANLFFTKANNQALKIARGRYLLILNQDTYFTDNSFKKTIDYMDQNRDVAVCEGLEIYEDGKIVPTGSKFSTPLIDFYELSLFGKKISNKKLIKEYRISNRSRKSVFEVDVACDAFLCVRKEILDKIKGYDETFLLFYTENDLCLRIKKLGFKIIHYGPSKVIHRVSSSTELLGWKKQDIYYRDLLHYYQKNKFSIQGYLLYSLLKAEEIILKILK